MPITKRPCANCPFRCDGAGIPLQPGRVEGIVSGLLADDQQTFVCHKTLDKERMTCAGTREENAQQVIDNVTSKQPEVHKTLACRRCGIEGLHWETFQNGYRLFSADGELHKCNAPDPVTSK